jgi:diguanylate cyclase (GGDEF)-like protein/PAS domain S-box-containing protein
MSRGTDGVRDVSLIESKEFLQSVYNALPCGIGIYTVSENPEILFLNSGYLKIYGYDGGIDYSQYDLYTDNDFFVDVLPSERAIVEGAIKKRLTGDSPVIYEVKALCKDGSIRFTKCTLDMIQLPNGEQYFQEVIVDITEEKILDRAKELNKYSKSLMAVFDRICEVSLSSNTIMQVSSKYQGKERPNAVTNCQVYFEHQSQNYVHPEDQHKYLQFTEFQNIRDTVAREGYSYCECKLKETKDGDYIYSAITILPVEDDYYLYCVMNIDSRIKQTVLEKENKFLQEKAERDSLTALLNRAATEDAVEFYLEKCGPESHCAMMVLDIDDFKIINDTYGHLQGDQLLIGISEVLQQHTRKNDVVGRFGGDEFVVFITDTQSDEVVIKKIHDFATEIRGMSEKLKFDLPVSVSFGVTMTSRENTSFAEMFYMADKALYMAKRSGKDRYAIL